MSKIISLLPLYYNKSVFLNSVAGALDKEVDLLATNREELKKQFIVDTATYTLPKYEEEYGLAINPEGLTIEERRSRVKARMRSVGTVTKELIKIVAESWSNGEVEVIEDFSNYSFTIKFISSIGVPTNIEDVKSAINEIKPAHLAVTYEFRYRTHSELTSKTHQQLSAFTHQIIREGVI